MLLAVRSRRVSVSRLSLSLSVPFVVTMTSMDDLGVVSNNSGAVMHLLVCLLAVLGHDVLALLDVGRVHDDIVLGVALLVGLAEALEVVVVGLVPIARLGLPLVVAMS